MSGFIVSAIIGGGGGYALGPLIRSMSTPSPQSDRALYEPPVRMQIEAVEGSVENLSPGGRWSPMRQGELVERPMGFRTIGHYSRVQLSYRGKRIVLSHNARVLFGAPGKRTGLQLDSGLMLVHSDTRPVTTHIPGALASLGGTAYGVWANGEHLRVTVLDGRLNFVGGTEAAVEYQKGQQLTVAKGQSEAKPIDPQLTITLGSRKRKVAGTTSPWATVLYAAKGDKLTEVVVSQTGRFVAGRSPPDALFTVAAFDAAGRIATPGKPSGSADEVFARLADGSFAHTPLLVANH